MYARVAEACKSHTKQPASQHGQHRILSESRLVPSVFIFMLLLCTTLASTHSDHNNTSTNTTKAFFTLASSLENLTTTTSSIIPHIIDSSSTISPFNHSTTVQSSLKQQSNGSSLVKSSQASNIHHTLNKHSERSGKQCALDQNWPTTECSEIAIQNCTWPYEGTLTRLCYSSCQWSLPEMSQCRLPRLAEIRSLVSYHVHKRLVDGLHLLAYELAKLISSPSSPIRNAQDRLLGLDTFIDILGAKRLHVRFSPEQQAQDYNFVQALVTTMDHLLSNQAQFTGETENNLLIANKTRQALFAFQELMENVLRALVVRLEESLDQLPENVTIANHFSILQFAAKHVRFQLNYKSANDKLVQILESASALANDALPYVQLHLQDLHEQRAGIALLQLDQLSLPRSHFHNSKWSLGKPILVTLVPAISINALFEQTPAIHVHFRLDSAFGGKVNSETTDSFKVPVNVIGQQLHCVQLQNATKSLASSAWSRAYCSLVSRNESHVHCVCSKTGYIALAQGAPFTNELDASRALVIVYTLQRPLLITSACIAFLLHFLTAIYLLMYNRESAWTSVQHKWMWTQLIACLALFQLCWIVGGVFSPDDEEPLTFGDALSYGGSLSLRLSHPPIRNVYTCLRALKHALASLIAQAWLAGVQSARIWVSSERVADELRTAASQRCLTAGLCMHYLCLVSGLWMLMHSVRLHKHLIDWPHMSWHARLAYRARKCLPGQSWLNTISRTRLAVTGWLSLLYRRLTRRPAPLARKRAALMNEVITASLADGTILECDGVASNSANCEHGCASPSKCAGKMLRVINSRSICRYFCLIMLQLIVWLLPAFVVLISYVKNPMDYELKRYCWMSIEGGMTYSFIVPVSFLITANTLIVLFTLRRVLVLQRTNLNKSVSQLRPLCSPVQLITLSAIYRQLHWFVCALPALATLWFLSILAVEQTQTQAFQYIYALFNVMFALASFLMQWKFTWGQNKKNQKFTLEDKEAIENNGVFSTEFDEELIVCVECELALPKP